MGAAREKMPSVARSVTVKEKHPLLRLPLKRFPLPVRRSQDIGEGGKKKELRSWRPRFRSPSTLERSWPARPFLRLAPPQTGFLKSSLRTWSWHRPGSGASQGRGAEKTASARPQSRRGDGLSAQARRSGALRDAVRLETGSPHPRAAVTSVQPTSSLGERVSRGRCVHNPSDSHPSPQLRGEENTGVKKSAVSISPLNLD